MSQDADYLFALKLQQQLNEEPPESNNSTNNNQANKKHLPPNEAIPSSGQSDFELAVQLQAQLNAESETDNEERGKADGGLPANSGSSDLDTSIQFVYSGQSTTAMAKAKSSRERENDYLNQTQNLVHPEWELVDPTPDISSMFVRFDEKFFQKRLGAVVVEWSKRMYSCAGICYQRGNRYFKEIIIRLSEPLLKLRPRKDLVETMLHEMIHAYCFVLNIREGNGGHGPNFKRIMNTINKVAGTNITVYHTFHDEVNAYRTHIWRCTGICQNHTPFQGWVKRTSNRAPGPSDQWWEKHQRECGGTFMKVSQPDRPVKMAKETTAKFKTMKSTNNNPPAPDDIRNYFGKPPPKRPALGITTNKPSGQISEPISQLASVVPPTSYPGLSTNPFGKLKTAGTAPRLFGFSDLNKSRSDSSPVRGGNLGNGVFGIRSPPREMPGQGYTLSDSNARTTTTTNTTTTKDGISPSRQYLRQLYIRRFGKDPPEPDLSKAAMVRTETSTEEANVTGTKRSRDEVDDTDNEIVSWESYDDDLMVRNVVVPVINISDSDDEIDVKPKQESIPSPDESQPRSASSPLNRHQSTMISSQERTRNIKREVMADESLRFSDDDIVLIDDEYDDYAADPDDENLMVATELADQSIIDDLFGEDTLLQEYQRENDVIPSGSRYHHNVNNDIVSCPICFEKMKRSQFANHLEGCSITIRVEPPSFKPKSSKAATNRNSNKNSSNTSTFNSTSTSTSNSTSTSTNTTRPRSKRNQSKTQSKSQSKSPRSSDSANDVTLSPGPQTRSASFLLGASKRMTRQSSKEFLRKSGYTEEQIAKLNLSSSSANTSNSDEEHLTPRQRRQRNLFKRTTPCPHCGQELMGHQLEAHGKLCTRQRRSKFK